jgi:transposase InsO family protein
MIANLHQEGYPLTALCQTLQVSRSGYYAFEQGPLSSRAQEDQRLQPQIRAIFWEHKRRYGARRIAYELSSRGVCCGTRRVGRLMWEMGLKAIQPKSFRPRTTDSRHRLGYSQNLLLEAPLPTGVNQVWVGDITYVPLKERDFLYLAMLMDLYSRRIVGWELRSYLKEPLVLAALRSAIRLRGPAADLIHHTDRGGQYAGNQYRGVLQRARMRQSMSRADNCYDNAFMESCFGTVKTELEMEYYENERDAREEIGGYLRYYNTRRRHSALGYLTPEEFEDAEFEDARCFAVGTSQRDPGRQKSTANRAQQNGRIKRYPPRG